MDADIFIIYYNAQGKIIGRKSINCYKCGSNGDDTYEIPKGATRQHVCFTTEYTDCNWKRCEGHPKYEKGHTDEDSEVEKVEKVKKRKIVKKSKNEK